MDNAKKPLGMKAYGSIPHLPDSRMGPADKSCHPGQSRIATQKVRDKNDTIIVQEKLDGSCVSIAKVDDKIFALSRAGYVASSSPYEQHHLFDRWVKQRYIDFHNLLSDGERIVGEWLAQAHSTRYVLNHEPFVPFDIMIGPDRISYLDFCDRISVCDFLIPAATVHVGNEALSINEAMSVLGKYGRHNALDEIEGAIWRVERNNKVDFLAKYVRPEKKDGVFLPEISGIGFPTWNWYPDRRKAVDWFNSCGI